MKRREFLGSVGAAVIGASSFPYIVSGVTAAPVRPANEPLPRRPFGKAGDQLSIIGFPGIMMRRYDQAYGNDLVRFSYERGVNYYDVAPNYGISQERLGPALEPFRKDVFLACKSAKRKKDEVLKEFEDSCTKLRTDYFDLYQLHAMITKDDVEQAFGPGGAIEALDKLKRDGAVRYLGFSSHSVEAAMACLKYYPFDAILYPISYSLWYKGNFCEQVMNYAIERGASVMTIKSMVRSKLTPEASKMYRGWWYRPMDDLDEASLAIRFALSLPVTAIVPPGTGGDRFFKMGLDLAPGFIPLTDAERDYLKKEASTIDPLFTFPSTEFDIIEKS